MNDPDKGTVPAPRSTPPDAPTPASAGGASTHVQHAAPTHLFGPDVLPAVPGYAMSREIARGGMGVVYAAHDPTFGREVAVKVMHAGQDADRFVIESKVTAQLPHPGVPPVYALGALADGRPFLAMKLVEGRTLADELKGTARAVDLSRLLGVFEQICQTVGFAHANGIVHRDLKPANVMVGTFGETLVMDWGIARLTGSAQPAGEGTPAYMAPEQSRGEAVDPRADVFALGGILAVMLTGRPPFVGGTATDAEQKAAAALGDCYAKLAACGADAELLAVAKRCLAADAADRYATGEEAAAAVSAYRASVEERLRKAERERAVSAAEAREQRKRRKVQLALAATIGLLLAAAGGFAWWRQKEATDREAAEARVAGERDTEQRFKAEEARKLVRILAADLRKQYKFKAAGTALEQAAELATGGAPELIAEVEQAQSDLAFVVRLDDIRFRKWAWIAGGGGKGKGDFHTKIAPPAYRVAFAACGLDLTALDPAKAAKQIAASEVKRELVAAVDDWALYEPDSAVRDRLLDIALRADPGPWLANLRDPAVRNDQAAVAKLATAADPTNTSAAALSVLAELMKRRGLDPAPLLSLARARYPTDFELAFALGQWHTANGGEGQIGPYEAARALRPENPAVWNNLGNALMSKGDWDGAVAAYKEAIRLDPELAHAHNNLGVGLADRGDWDGAVAAIKEAIKHDPKLGLVYSNLGLALKANGDWDGAVAAYKEAIRLDPKLAQPHNNLGAGLADRGDWGGAVAAYKEAIRLDPKHALIHYNLGIALGGVGDRDGAVAAYKEAIRLDLKYAPLYYNLGIALKSKGDLAGAVAAYKEAIRLDPKYALAHNNLGIVLANMGDQGGAMAAFKEALKHDPKHAPAHTNLGLMLKAMGDWGGAVAAYKEALKHDPKHAPAHTNLGVVLADRGNRVGAVAAYKEAIKHDPKHAPAHSNLGVALYSTGDRVGAVAAYKEAIKHDPKLALTHTNLGVVLAEQGDLAGAVAAHRESIRLDPKYAKAHYNLGIAVGAKGDWDGAIAAYKEAIRLAPEYAPAHTSLGVIYAQQKKYPDAIACARAAIKVDPKHSNASALLGHLLQQTGDITGARAALTEAARLDKRWAEMLAKLPPVPVAPPPREVNR